MVRGGWGQERARWWVRTWACGFEPRIPGIIVCVICGGFVGYLGKNGVLRWFFCGEHVVKCVVNVVRKQRVSERRFVGHVIWIYFSSDRRRAKQEQLVELRG
jgi:hypothetical protein